MEDLIVETASLDFQIFYFRHQWKDKVTEIEIQHKPNLILYICCDNILLKITNAMQYRTQFISLVSTILSSKIINRPSVNGSD